MDRVISFPKSKYQVIYADPPWQYGSKQYQDGGRDFDKLESHYNVLNISDIKSLPVRNITSEDCALFIWVTDSHLKAGIEVIESWGFRYKTVAFVWLKIYESGKYCVNFAPWTLKSTELCLLGMKGAMGKYKTANNVRQLVKSIRTNHSKKPQEIRNRIITLFGNCQRIELFARDKIDGWDCWGDEVEA